MNTDRLQALNAAKLAALVRDRWGVDDGQPGSFPDGASLSAGDTGWVLVGKDGARRLGASLAWARQRSVTDLHLLSEDPAIAGVLARRAGLFAHQPTVWRVDGRTSTLARAAPPPTFAALPPTAELFRPLLVAAGLSTVTEQGELLGELNGLEVARVVPESDEPATDTRLEVGVGRFDREAFAMMNADLPDAEALAKAVAIVAGIRTNGAPRHQLNQLVPERWMRSVALADPSLVGASSLAPVESAIARKGLKELAPASALGTDLAGKALMVTFSNEVDLDLVPTAADDRLAHAPNARLVLVLPARNIVPVIEDLASALANPAEVIALDAGWPTSGD